MQTKSLLMTNKLLHFRIFLSLLAIVFATSLQADPTQIPLTKTDDNKKENSGLQRSPTIPPCVLQDGITLYIDSPYTELFIQLTNNEYVVYTSPILNGVCAVELPENLSGEYTLIIYTDEGVFEGTIQLIEAY